MTREEAIKVLRTESIELGGSAPSVCRFWEALDMAIYALRQQELSSYSKVVKSSDMYDEDGGEIMHGETVTNSHKMTNADRIRSMSDEELAKAIISIPMCVGTDDDKDCEKDGCKDCFLKWLQQPAEEDDHA